MAERRDQRDILQVLMSNHCDTTLSEFILQSSVIILKSNTALFLMCLAKSRESDVVINGESIWMKMFKYLDCNSHHQFKTIYVPTKMCLMYYKLLRNRLDMQGRKCTLPQYNKNGSLHSGLIVHHQKNTSYLYCLSNVNNNNKKDSKLLRFGIEKNNNNNTKIKTVTQIDPTFHVKARGVAIQTWDILTVFNNKIQLIAFHDQTSKMYHATYNSTQNKFEMKSIVPYYKTGESGGGLYFNMFHLDSYYIRVLPSNPISPNGTSSLWMFGNCELVEYDGNNNRWIKYPSLLKEMHKISNLKSICIASAIIDKCWLILIDTTGYLVLFNIHTGEQIFYKQFKFPVLSIFSGSYEMRIICNKKIEQSNVISFVTQVRNEIKWATWPLCISNMIMTYYCNDYIHIINNDNSAFSPFYLYSWVFSIDELFHPNY